MVDTDVKHGCVTCHDGAVQYAYKTPQILQRRPLIMLVFWLTLALFLQLSPLEDENDEPCDVCFEGDSDELNEIIFCDGCDIAVHQNCYGVATVPRGEDPWFCLRCSAPDPEAVLCVLCPLKKGAMKPLATEGSSPGAGPPQGAVLPPVQHAHLFCAQWVPETYIREGDGAVMNVEGVLRERYKLTCVLCKVKQGVCIQCSHGERGQRWGNQASFVRAREVRGLIL